MPVLASPPEGLRGRSRHRARTALLGLVIGAVAAGLVVAPAASAELPEQEPGVTLRTFKVPPGLTQLCTLKSGTTPNVDKLMPTVQYTTPEEFGATDDFISHVIANLNVPTPGDYTFRLTSDDGSKLHLDGALVIDHDGLHGATAKETTQTLAAGSHPLFIEFFEAGYGQELKLEWRTPNSSSFQVIPSSALSTDADVVRVTAPGTKYCEGSSDTAGDGLRLDSVNPNYQLTDLRPAGFEPKVSGLDFMGDRLVVTTSGSVSPGGWVPDPEPGEVFLLDNVLGDTSPENVVVTKAATGLLNPMGVDVIDDKIYVSERHQLTELSDPDGDGFYDIHSKVAEWPDGGNFHEFAFGLIHDDQYFYANLSVAIDAGGASTDPQPAPNRGTSIKIDRATGEVTYVAGGLRTPNGIAFGPNGDVFAMDNQGGWLPSSKLVHVEQDRFFNHYSNPDGPFDANPVTQPVLWIPQNEIGNSPSTPMMLDAGPFAGQMLFGDVTYGGLQRAFIEQVDGEYQGAVFRHSAGFEAGVNRVITGPDGALYVGGIGEGGNWGESGKLSYGLQKLTPVGDGTFDMKSVKVVEGGFAIEYTEPISEGTATDIANAYRAEQWRYVPTSSYGGPKVDEESLVISDAQVSEDRRTVTLSVDGLKPGRVVHLRSPRPFESASGDELWNTEAWYTLNSLPGYVPPADRGWYEAESAALMGGADVDTEHSGYAGFGFVDGIQTVGAGVSFTVQAEADGTYPVSLRYANGPNPFQGTKDVSLYVNGAKIGPWELPSTTDWKTWATVTRDLDLVAGANTIALKFDSGDDGNVNLDVLSVGTTDICTPAEIEEGYTALFDGTLASFDDWRLAGPGSFGRQDDCSLRTSGGLGLLWYRAQEFGEYSLKLDWKLVQDHNGGVFVGFPNPGNDPWVAVNQGYEIQIDATDQADRTTGAIYTFQGADAEAVAEALNPVGAWNAYEIVVQGQTIKVFLNGTLVNDFTSTDPARDLAQGFIGIQNHGNGETVYYRNIRLKDIDAPAELAVSATSEVRCVAGKAYLSVRATNNDTVPMEVTLSTEFGERTFASVQPGGSAFHSFTTRKTALAAGTVDVAAAGDGRTGAATAGYAAKSCG